MLINLPAANLEEIEAKMLVMPQADCPVYHYFSDGLYIRELHMAAGTLAIGHIQKFPQVNIFIKGKILMLKEDGTQGEFSAPATFVGPPGRKVGLVLEDLIWQNVYPNPENETDIDLLEEKFIKKSDTWLRIAETGVLDEVKNSVIRYGVQL
jgi:hypothetical protein